MQRPRQTREGAYAVTVKPSAEVRETLRQAAKAAGRTLNKEMELRLAASVGASQPEIDRVLFGWRDDALRRNRAIGRSAGALAYRQERLAGEAGPVTLAMLKVAMGVFLDRLGATDGALTEDHRTMAKALAEQLYNDIREAPQDGVAPDILYESAAIATIADDLGVYRPKPARSMKNWPKHVKKKGDGK